jgi:hypothetical protein
MLLQQQTCSELHEIYMRGKKVLRAGRIGIGSLLNIVRSSFVCSDYFRINNKMSLALCD